VPNFSSNQWVRTAWKPKDCICDALYYSNLQPAASSGKNFSEIQLENFAGRDKGFRLLVNRKEREKSWVNRTFPCQFCAHLTYGIGRGFLAFAGQQFRRQGSEHTSLPFRGGQSHQ
jgi:hypothetical protein